jgi:hypothetical protein
MLVLIFLIRLVFLFLQAEMIKNNRTKNEIIDQRSNNKTIHTNFAHLRESEQRECGEFVCFYFENLRN